jgi:hypothetical protein
MRERDEAMNSTPSNWSYFRGNLAVDLNPVVAWAYKKAIFFVYYS